MIHACLPCTVCGQQVTTPITVDERTPYWARELWQQALAGGWARDEATYAAYCPDCQAFLAEPSTQQVPLQPMTFASQVACGHCAATLAGPQPASGQHFSQRLRTQAKDAGWRLVRVADDHYADLCPICAESFFAPRYAELARLVWSTPVQVAAREMGISDKALAKQCARLNLPRPPRGFWARYHAGKMTLCRAAIPAIIQTLLGPDFLDEVYPVGE